MRYKNILLALSFSLVTGSIIMSDSTSAENNNSTSLMSNFSDINSALWATKFINQMEMRSIIKGYQEDGNLYFRPNQQIRQIEAITMVLNYLGYADEAENFKKMEVTEENPKYQLLQGVDLWAKGYVLIASELNLIDKNSPAGFNPNEVASRDWLVNLLVNAISKHGELKVKESVSFSDENTFKEWAYPSIMAASKAKILKGYEDGSFKPENKVTRAEMAAMLYQAEEYVKSEYQSDIVFGKVVVVENDSLIIDFGNDKVERRYFSNHTVSYYGAELIDKIKIKQDDTIQAVTNREGQLIFVDIINGPSRVEVDLEGEIYVISAAGNTVTIKDTTGTLLNYTFAENVVVHKENEVISLDDIHINDKVQVVTKDDEIIEINIVQAYENENITEVVSVNTDKRILTVVTLNGDVKAYNITNEISIKNKAGQVEALSSIKEGDKLILVFEKEMLVSILIPKIEYKDAVITDITKSSKTIEFNNNDQVFSYTYTTDLKVNLEGYLFPNSNNLDEGDIVNLVVDNDKITQIDVLNRSKKVFIYSGIDTAAKWMKVQSVLDQKYVYLNYLDTAVFYKDGKKLSSYSSYSIGERVEITFVDFDKIKQVEVASNDSGEIVEIDLDKHRIKIEDINGKYRYLTFFDDIVVKIDNTVITVEKLRVGDDVTFYTFGDRVIEIVK